MIIDHLIIICKGKGCSRQQRVDLDPPLEGSEQFKRWLDLNLALYACECGWTHCDVKAHLVGQQEY